MAEFDKLWDYGKPAETELRFRELLPLLDSDRRTRAELLTQIARTQGLQRRFAEAHATLDEVESLGDAGGVARIRYLLERGRAFRSAGEVERSLPLFHDAWEIGQSSGEDDLAVDAAHMLGIALADPEERMAWNLRALELAEASPKAESWLGSLYNNIGWEYADAGNYARALELFERAVAFRQRRGTPGTIRVARWCVAKMQRMLGQEAVALAEQQALLALAQGEPDGFIHEEIAENLLALGRMEEAKPQFGLAYDLLSQEVWLVESEPVRVERLKELGGR